MTRGREVESTVQLRDEFRGRGEEAESKEESRRKGGIDRRVVQSHALDEDV
jgi:hypothetical protein